MSNKQLQYQFTLDEIIKAKEVLWDECVMLTDDPPKRQKSNQRSVNINCSRDGYCRRHV